MNRAPAWPRALLRAWLRACTVPHAHAASPLAPAPDAALAAVRVDAATHHRRPHRS
ncbi:hypothetical protein SAZ_40445 [Streptomyces noursei ZPM]|uniref:Uncharacterized protein n=1 Tax=Streptomyces noursei TaxID=1971 RepID=A0A401QQQ4_STRNR|nr:hypothetical protein [Streptomyces noursei]AKA09209.1 hypothetical protein SAZ_40445 [Streptomyces noursei ZPM]EPY92142.1 hypothetical protein K530_54930 [Streptomyces noursei CCRC 11814]UWS76554.1 hypothetical protein N1H47_38095 [Streptomyces noursei]GCB87726.1 hypothetical protein SALB_00395 [Streptomyces noursei]